MLKLTAHCTAIALICGFASAHSLVAATAGRPSTLKQTKQLVLWYRQPAVEWMEALPIGNGRLAGMVFGKVDKETIEINEETIWSGGPRDTNNPEALQYLPEVRKLIFEGKYKEAEDIAAKHMIGRPGNVRPYQALADLTLDFGASEATDYRRELDLDTGVARVSYTQGGAKFTREAFVSAVDQVLVVRITCDKPGRANATVGISREQNAVVKNSGQDSLILTGQVDGTTGLKFQANTLVLHDRGTIQVGDGTLIVKAANSITVFVSAASDYRGGDPAAMAGQMLKNAAAKSYDSLLKAHLKEHRSLFRRVALNLDGNGRADLPTDERLAAMKNGADDPGLAALLFQYGRYLLMGSSRPGCLPANLQGKWVDGMRPPWSSDYHTNINIQMNYWPAEVCNLSECATPLMGLIESLREPGRKTARIHYGCSGWTVHHLTDAWGFTTPADGAWGIWPVGAAWLCSHVWEHYAYTQDRKFLDKQGYPIMKEAAEFLLDFLVEDSSGRLVTNPSHSPENSFRTPDGKTALLCAGATMDLELIHDLFTHCIQSSEILGRDGDFRAKLQSALAKLEPLRVGKSGLLQEWTVDFDLSEPGHRHMSHLFGVFPGNQITQGETPRLYRAARLSLDSRLDHRGGSTGWSRAWVISLMARFGDGDGAYESVAEMLRGYFGKNLFDVIFKDRMVFQIDGNLGYTAGVAEMLLQSHEGEINLLPALPKAWPSGSVKGLCARGGYTVDMTWKSGKLASVKIRAKVGGPVKVRLHGVGLQARNGSPELVATPDGAVTFNAAAGRDYEFKAR